MAESVPSGALLADGDECLSEYDRPSYEAREPGGAAFSHGYVCLDESQYVAAAREFRRSLHVQPRSGEHLCALVGLGIAYFELSRYTDALHAWERANANQPIRPTLGLEVPLLQGDDSSAMAMLKRRFASRAQGGGTLSYAGAPAQGYMQLFDTALGLATMGHEGRGAEIISRMYARGLMYDGAVRYARAVMLLTLGQTREAKGELELAAREPPLVMAAEDCRPLDYQFSAIDLLQHLGEFRRASVMHGHV